MNPAIFNRPIVRPLSKFSLTPYAADIPAAYSVSRALYESVIGANIFRLRNSNSTTEGDVTAAGLTGITESAVTSLRDGTGQLLVKTLQNQSSIGGAWPNASQSTAAQQVIFEEATASGYSVGGRAAFYNPKDATRSLPLGTSKTIPTTWAVAMVARYTGTYGEQAVGLGSSGHLPIFKNSDGKFYSSSLASYDNGDPNFAFNKFGNRPLVIVVTWKAGENAIYINGWRAALGASSALTLTVSHLSFANLSNITWLGQQSEFVIFNSADSSGIVPYATNAASFFSAKPLVFCIGDSITDGYGASGSPVQTYPQQLLDDSDYIVTGEALAGRTAATGLSAVTGTMLDSFGARMPGDSTKNAAVCLFGPNDLSGGASAAATYANLITLWTACRSAGFNAVACTPLGCVNGGSLTQQKLADLATLIRSDPSQYDALVDIAADSRIGYGQHGNTTYFGDGVHPINAGYTVLKDLVKSTLDTLYP